MLKKYCIERDSDLRRGQSLIEYSLLMGIIVTIIIAMGPMIKYTSQGMIKSVTDLIGNQEASEQQFNEIGGGYLVYSVSDSRVQSNHRVEQLGRDITLHFNDTIDVGSSASIDMGFTRETGN